MGCVLRAIAEVGLGDGGMKTVAPNTQQLAFRKALEDAIAQHGLTLDAMEILAVLSHLVGQVIALQDQRTVTPLMAMELVQKNIEIGNQAVVSGLLNAAGGHA